MTRHPSTIPRPALAVPRPTVSRGRLRGWHVWLWPAIFVALGVGMWLMPWSDWTPDLRDWAAGQGAVGVALYLLAYVVVVILPLPAAAMSVAGGLAYGWWGFPLAMLGSVLGAVTPYLIGRIWWREPLLQRFSGARLMAADRAIERNGMLFVTLLRLTPVLPFTAQNWLLGLTAVRIRTYLLGTTIGLAPGTLAMVWIGEMGGLASVGADRAQLWLAGGGLAAFGALVLWMARVATRELRRAGFPVEPSEAPAPR